MRIWLDEEYRCHTNNPEGVYRQMEDPFFDGKCDLFVEGYRFIPAGEQWIGPDGTVFQGKMISAWKDYDELDGAQREYERQLIAEYEALINELYSEVTA